jgi:TolA-binding protein
MLLFLVACSTKKNNFFTRNYHYFTTNYNVYFNGNEAFKQALKKMEANHKEDYTNLLPVFVSSNDQTRSMCNSDMDYAIEKAVKAIDKHSITAKPKRRGNKDSKRYEDFRKKREYNDMIPDCYLLMGKAYFYKKQYSMANNTFRHILRQYSTDEKLVTETQLWLFRSHVEMGHYDEAANEAKTLAGVKLTRRQKELFYATNTELAIKQNNFSQAIDDVKYLVDVTSDVSRSLRYKFILAQLYLQENRQSEAMAMLKKLSHFNFNYEMAFNAKIDMALAYTEDDKDVKKTLQKMLKDVKNEEFKDRIYYALGNIADRDGDEKGAIDYYWQSVRNSVSNDNQKSLSFLKLGDYYFADKDYVNAQLCYDSCMFFMDTRVENYDDLKLRVTNLTSLVNSLNVIYTQDSLQRIAALPEAERNRIIDEQIQKIKDDEAKAKELERQAQQERSFYYRSNMMSYGGGGSGSNNLSSGDWYFYNPMTIAMGKNEFRRKWGRRRLEDNWRRINKSMVAPTDVGDMAITDSEPEEEVDLKSKDYYLKNLPLTPEQLAVSNEKLQNAYYSAGELYLYTFNDPVKALECFEAYINRYKEGNKLPQVYYLAYYSANEIGETIKAEGYKNDLIKKFPDNELTKSILDPNYSQKTETESEEVNKLYEVAYNLYEEMYYSQALDKANEILLRYPDNKLKSNVLFLRAMCMLNLGKNDEIRVALNDVLDSKPSREISDVVNSIMASMNVGSKPVAYTESDMSNARYLRSNRHWVFSDTIENKIDTSAGETPYLIDNSAKYDVIIVLPEDIKTVQTLQLQGRLTYINAGNIISGKDYKMTKENLWYKVDALKIGTFEKYAEAEEYLTRISGDRNILKILGNSDYRIFAISTANLEMLKRLKDVDGYLDFFVKNYFKDSRKGEAITGQLGTSAHIFTYSDDSEYDVAFYLPFRKVNMNRLAGILKSIESAYVLSREDYDENHEILLLENVGNKTQALEQMNLLMQNQALYDRLKSVDYEYFIITKDNLSILKEGKYIKEYMSFFEDNYLRDVKGENGIEDGDFVYNKELPHRFVLLYSNKIDPFKLKEAFEDFNYTGLTINNQKYDEEYDCLTVSGFNDEATAMRYFNAAIKDRNLTRPLKNTNYRNFIITEYNLKTVLENKNADKYLIFFKRYYLDK